MSANRATVVAPILAALVLAAMIGLYLFQHSRPPSPDAPPQSAGSAPPQVASNAPATNAPPASAPGSPSVSPAPQPERQAIPGPSGAATTAPNPAAPADMAALPPAPAAPAGRAGSAGSTDSAGAASPAGSATAPVGGAPAPGGATAAKSGPEKSADGQVAPSFDVVRVEPNGDSVIAGRATPGAAVDLLDNGRSSSRVVADSSGLFAIVPPALAPGTHEIVLQTVAPDGTRTRSTQSVTVVIVPGRDQQPLVTVSAPDQPTVVLSRPEEPKPRTEVASNQPGPNSAGQGTASPSSAAAPGGSPTPASPPQPVARAAPRPDVRIASVDAEGDRLFVGGVAAPGATLRLYLNDAYVAPGATGPDGRLSFTIGKGIRPGDYRVRLDDVDPVSGAVRSRVEVPFTVPEPVVAAAAPPNRVAGITPGTGPTAAPPASGGTASPPPAGREAIVSTPGASGTASSSSGAAPAAGTNTASAARTGGGSQDNAPATTSPAPPPPAVSTRTAETVPAPTVANGAPAREAGASTTSPAAPAPSGTAPETGANPRRVAAAPRGTSDAPGSDTLRLGTDPGQVLVPEVNTAIVARGDNLWRISKRTYGEGLRYTVIFGANSPQIRNPDLIYPGQVFVLPAQGEGSGLR